MASFPVFLFPSIIVWFIDRKHRKHVKKFLSEMDGLNIDAADNAITKLYTEGKIGESDYGLLKDKISDSRDNKAKSHGSPVK